MAGAYDWLYDLVPGQGDAAAIATVAKDIRARGDREVAATAYDRAYALRPGDHAVAAERAELLDELAVREHGLVFRYVPAGCYMMGSADGDPDERPVHPVRLDPFWLTDVPVSWSAYCALMDWEPPPAGHPREYPDGPRKGRQGPGAEFYLREASKIRLQYCEDATTRALDWHAHDPGGEIGALFGNPPREDPRRPQRYDRKPMIAVAWQEAERLAERISGGGVRYRLPTEAEWEAGARGGLLGKRYPWGDEPPTPKLCDFDRFNEFSVSPMRRAAPNGYGLYGMSGGVWEWTADWYDALYYQDSPRENPDGPLQGTQRVLRGGSWTDCAEVVTVSFRFSREATPWWDAEWGKHLAPNIGFRLCRTARG